ncbi:MAG: alanine racemase C-terminal domain-containing protein, partial [Bacteroidota bacterium]
CMDMAMVDVSDVPCNAGDEVVLFGEEPTVEEMARACDTIPYEILTAVSQRVKRVFIAE